MIRKQRRRCRILPILRMGNFISLRRPRNWRVLSKRSIASNIFSGLRTNLYEAGYVQERRHTEDRRERIGERQYCDSVHSVYRSRFPIKNIDVDAHSDFDERRTILNSLCSEWWTASRRGDQCSDCRRLWFVSDALHSVSRQWFPVQSRARHERACEGFGPNSDDRFDCAEGIPYGSTDTVGWLSFDIMKVYSLLKQNNCRY